MSKTWIIIIAIIVMVIVVVVVLWWCPCCPTYRTTIGIVPCDIDPKLAMAETSTYNVRVGKEVVFVNESGTDVTVTLLNCDLFEGNPDQFDLDSGKKKTFVVKATTDGGATCKTLVDPGCGIGGPELVPYP